jgi:hypothetical protein
MKPAFTLALLGLTAICAGVFLWPRSMERATAVDSGTPVKPKSVASLATPEQLMKEVESVRGLHFKSPPVFVPVTAAELEKAIRSGWEKDYPAAVADARMRSAMALGLTREVFNIPSCLAGLTMEQPVAWYDESDPRFLYDRDLNLARRADLRGRMVFEIARALVLQHTVAGQLSRHPPAGDDAMLSAENVIQGDAMIVQTRHAISFPGNPAIAESPPATINFYEAPPFLRSWFLFGSGMAEIFQSGLISSASAGTEANAVLNGILSRPPQTTAEIMHPDVYSSGSFSPEAIVISATKVLGIEPIADCVLGEYVTLLVLKSQLNQEQSRNAAAGWHGDRCLVCPGSGGGENRDHFFWKTRWATAEDAKEFLSAIRTVLLHRNALLPEPRYNLPDNGLAVNEPAITLRASLTKDGRSVMILSSPDAGFAKRMESQLSD